MFPATHLLLSLMTAVITNSAFYMAFAVFRVGILLLVITTKFTGVSG